MRRHAALPHALAYLITMVMVVSAMIVVVVLLVPHFLDIIGRTVDHRRRLYVDRARSYIHGLGLDINDRWRRVDRRGVGVANAD